MAEMNDEQALPEQGEMFELDDELEVEDTEDGGAIVRMKNEQDARERAAHFEIGRAHV